MPPGILVFTILQLLLLIVSEENYAVDDRDVNGTIREIPANVTIFPERATTTHAFRSRGYGHEIEYVDALWPVKRSAEMTGDLILGALMMVHEREETIMCGPIMPQGGIQALETMLYTLDVVNGASLLPNVTIGAHILDDCDKDTYGLEMAVDFIKEGKSHQHGEKYAVIVKDNHSQDITVALVHLRPESLKRIGDVPNVYLGAIMYLVWFEEAKKPLKINV